MQRVTVARFAGGRAVIADGLQPAATVVASGQALLAPGRRVQAAQLTEAQANAPTGRPQP